MLQQEYDYYKSFDLIDTSQSGCLSRGLVGQQAVDTIAWGETIIARGRHCAGGLRLVWGQDTHPDMETETGDNLLFCWWLLVPVVGRTNRITIPCVHTGTAALQSVSWWDMARWNAELWVKLIPHGSQRDNRWNFIVLINFTSIFSVASYSTSVGGQRICHNTVVQWKGRKWIHNSQSRNWLVAMMSSPFWVEQKSAGKEI